MTRPAAAGFQLAGLLETARLERTEEAAAKMDTGKSGGCRPGRSVSGSALELPLLDGSDPVCVHMVGECFASERLLPQRRPDGSHLAVNRYGPDASGRLIGDVGVGERE